MTRPIGVLLAPGTNCHEETVFAIEQAGQPAELLLASDITEGIISLMDYPAIVIPGGFSWGDYFGSGRAFGLILGDFLRQFAEDGRPILGICNGFQAMMEAGLFDEGELSGGALVQNLSGKFESRWSRLLTLRGSPWTEGIEWRILRMPVAHGEGRWRIPDNTTCHLKSTFLYTDSTGKSTTTYPDNPNGSPGGVTGLANGLVMGMMPHPERAVRPELGSIDGRLIFDALVRLTQAA